MASRVNVKFVLLLSTVLVLVAGGTGFLAYKVVFKSADDLAASGDEKMAEQDFKAAEFFYSKAVNKDPLNPKYLLKWRDALTSWTPETDRELQTEFENNYLGISRQLALSDNRANIQYQIEQAELLWTLAGLSGSGRASMDAIINAVNDNIRFHERSRPDDPSWVELRKYRGLARARVALGGLDLTEADLEQAFDDLTAALEADPTDYDSLETLVALKRNEAETADQGGRFQVAEQLRSEADAALDEFLQTAESQSVESALAELLKTEIAFRNEASEVVREHGAGATPRLLELTGRYQQQTQAIAERLLAADAQLVDRQVVQRLVTFEGLTDPERRYEASLPVLERAHQTFADDPLLSLNLADILDARGEFDRSYEVLQDVLDRPRLPIGLPGFVLMNAKTVGVAEQVDSALRAHAAAESDEARDRWLERARASRERLGQLVADGATRIQLLDARIAVAEGDLFTAQNLLQSYNDATTNSDREALWLTARVAQDRGQAGLVRSSLERLIEIDRTATAALIALAELEYEQGQLELARDLLESPELARLNDPRVIERLRMINARLNPETAEDPVEGAIFRAVELAGGSETEIADPAAGIRSLREAIQELGPDARLFAELGRLQLVNGDPEAARTTVAEGLVQFPDDALLLRVQTAANAAGDLDTLIAMIRDSDRTDVQKELAIYAALSQNGRTDEANATLDRATAMEPDNATVLELLFTRAFERDDIDEARSIADRARAADADRIGGLSYRSRLLLMEGDYEGALSALEQAIDRSPNNTALLRLLARTQLRQGQTADAIASLEQALAVRPDEMQTVMELCQVLIRQNRQAEALEIARRSETVGRANAAFMEILLSLEGSVGDREAARARREKILEARPGDHQNRLALVGLYITLGAWDEARALINASRDIEEIESLLVGLEARWHAEQNDLESARRVFASRIASVHPDERLNEYLALAQFMLQRNQTNAGLVALRQADRYEPDGEFRIDNLLGNTLMRFGRFNEAVDVLRRVLDEDPDASESVALQAAEALIALGRLDEAETVLARVPDAEQNATVVLLRARVLLAREDDSQARSLLDDAVSRWPNDHRVWVMRAEAEARVPELVPDALADLARAIELRPDIADTHSRRAELLARLGREDESLRAWSDAVRLNPANEELRSSLLLTLIRRGQEVDAVQLAEDWFEQRPRDVQLRTRLAELFLLGGMRDAGTSLLLGAFEIDPQPRVVMRLCDLLLGSQPPRYSEAERILTEARHVVITDPALLLARAHVFANSGRAEAARNDILASFQILTDRTSDNVTFWFGTMRGVFDDKQETLAIIRRIGSLPGGADWSRLFTARVLLADPATTSEGVSQLRSIIDATRDAQVKYTGLRALAGHLYNNGQSEDALAVWRRSLELRPDDWQVENNIAYVLATDLGRPEEALPYAQSATRHAPNEASALDTLGTIYLELGRPADAVTPFRSAVAQTRGRPEDAMYMVRYAEALLAHNDRDEARSVLVEVQALLERGRTLDEEHLARRQRVLDALGEG